MKASEAVDESRHERGLAADWRTPGESCKWILNQGVQTVNLKKLVPPTGLIFGRQTLGDLGGA